MITGELFVLIINVGVIAPPQIQLYAQDGIYFGRKMKNLDKVKKI
jgi:hypothetical protein